MFHKDVSACVIEVKGLRSPSARKKFRVDRVCVRSIRDKAVQPDPDRCSHEDYPNLTTYGRLHEYSSMTTCYCNGYKCNYQNVDVITGKIDGKLNGAPTTTTTPPTTTTTTRPKNEAASSNWSHGGISFMLIVSTGIMMMMIVW